ncbi:hypothetical protein [Streptosporangium sp. KLBMP 9127]|nr:hypothetical protein [Streptosporangium sp. KLBMP 9127]
MFVVDAIHDEVADVLARKAVRVGLADEMNCYRGGLAPVHLMVPAAAPSEDVAGV